MRYKFRGKRCDTGEWVVGFFHQVPKGGWMMPVKNSNVITTYKVLDNGEVVLTGAYEVIPESAGQWTGLVDMDMVEAYEKDVVDVYFQDGDVERAVLIWDARRFRYQLKSSERSLWGFDDTLRFKIVGNLIDSPELMEVE